MNLYYSFFKTITKLINELDLSMDKTSISNYKDFQQSISNTENFIKSIISNEDLSLQEIEKYYDNIKLYISDIDNIVLKKTNNSKINKNELDFLNEIHLFNTFDFKNLNELNKNTKIVIIQYLKSITDIVLAIKNIKPLTIVADSIHESSKTHLVKSKRVNKKKNKNNLNNVINNLSGMVETLMKDEKIQELVEDVKNDLENSNQDPMQILQSLLNGKNNEFINNTMKKVKSKMDNGDLKLNLDLDKHLEDISDININDIQNVVFSEMEKMNKK
jgi:hypothetical protein